jgi:hypothetical protein
MMPLFPMQRRPMMAGAMTSGAMQPSSKGMPTDPLNQGLTQTPRGLFGRLGNALGGGAKGRDWSHILGTIGAGLQQMDGGTELTDYLANREAEMLRRDMWGNQVRGQKMDEAAAEDERAAAMSEAQREREEAAQMEADIARLPVEQQLLARMNPQAFVGGMMRHRYPAPQRWMDDDPRPNEDDGWSYED